MIKFWRTTGKYGCFSNFSRHPIVAHGKRYATTEHYYQAHKATSEEDHEEVRKASGPFEAKQKARELKLPADWEGMKFSIMLAALRFKAQQYEFIREKLLETGDEDIAEDSPKDPIWGLGKDGKGQNLLGKAWMQVREELKVTCGAEKA